MIACDSPKINLPFIKPTKLIDTYLFSGENITYYLTSYF